MVEIELKYQIKADKLHRYHQKIADLGFQYKKPRVYDKKVLYDNPQHLMEITNGRIRLRQSGEDAEFCYKKPVKNDSGIKKEIEHQVEVSDFKITQKIIEMMEFKPNYSYERFRTKYSNGKVEIVLDEFPFANFMEIEGLEQEILQISDLLELHFADNLVESCDSLFAKYRKLHKLPPTNIMAFDSFDK